MPDEMSEEPSTTWLRKRDYEPGENNEKNEND